MAKLNREMLAAALATNRDAFERFVLDERLFRLFEFQPRFGDVKDDAPVATEPDARRNAEWQEGDWPTLVFRDGQQQRAEQKRKDREECRRAAATRLRFDNFTSHDSASHQITIKLCRKCKQTGNTIDRDATRA